MHTVDWTLVIVPTIGLIFFALWTRRFVKGASDYIAGGRLAGRYLLANARGEAGSGLTNTISHFEMYLAAGFITIFWGWVSVPVAILIAISGFVVYRYRQSRSLTLAQYLEARYSPNFRLFMGCIIFTAGALNYAIFPFVSSQFFIYFLDLPIRIAPFGFEMPTFIAIMACYMSVSCALVMFGGQVNLMVSDCIEGIFSHAAYIVIIVVLLLIVPWSEISQTLVGAVPGQEAMPAALEIQPDKSPVNPMDAFKTKDFNFWYVAIGIVSSVYLTMAWQGGHGFNSAARTPHESRMGGILGQWRQFARTLLLVVMVVSAMTFLRHPAHETDSQHAKERIAAIAATPVHAQADGASAVAAPVGSQRWYESPETTSDQKKHAVTVSLSEMLPMGVKGLLLLVLVMGLFAGDGNHLHSWSSVFVQDVVLQLRRRRGLGELTPERHLSWLRWAVLGTALFAFVFSAVIMPRLDMPIWFWWGITGAIFNAGAGAVIIGGFYWRRGTTAGAWAAMIIGAVLAVTSTVIDFQWKQYFAGQTILGVEFPIAKPYSMPWVGLGVLLTAATTYVLVSMLTPRPAVDLDALLNRGADQPGDPRPWWSWRRLVGIDGDFSRSDTFVAGFIFFFSLSLVGVLVLSLGWHWSTKPFNLNPLEGIGFGLGLLPESWHWGNADWAVFWLWFGLIIPGIFTVVTLVWFSVGGIRDIRAFFRDLRALRRDIHDDGTTAQAPPPSGDRPERTDAR